MPFLFSILIKLRKLYTYLQEHSGPVTDVAFIAADVVVTASEDRTFVVSIKNSLSLLCVTTSKVIIIFGFA